MLISRLLGAKHHMLWLGCSEDRRSLRGDAGQDGMFEPKPKKQTKVDAGYTAEVDFQIHVQLGILAFHCMSRIGGELSSTLEV